MHAHTHHTDCSFQGQ